jgi:hypothetical protein
MKTKMVICDHVDHPECTGKCKHKEKHKPSKKHCFGFHDCIGSDMEPMLVTCVEVENEN